MNLWLIGMMGSGKSTIGPLVANELSMEFVDTDLEIEAQLGEPISDYWEAHGQDAFRRAERAEIVRVSSSNAVISTGGGAPITSANRATMMSTGRIIWIRAGLKTIESRLGDMKSRPLLGEKPLAEILASREKVYSALADVRFDADNTTPEEVAGQIAEWWVA